nr:DNA cytosine methyltransferase [uncultured Gellertiella sp.]
MSGKTDNLIAVELCAGAGGQALGLERAGFGHAGLFENDPHACATLRLNRPAWPVFEHDLFEPFDFSRLGPVDLLAGGLPCPPFSVAGKQLGEKDERNLFTKGVDIALEINPEAVLFENVRGMLDPSFASYRATIERRLKARGYVVAWKLLNASDFGVPQLRPRVVMVALKKQYAARFSWPVAVGPSPSVADTLHDLMGSRGWPHLSDWRQRAGRIAPTLVGGSKKHGGPDLGPTRARKAWAEFGIDGRSIAEEAPGPDHEGMPRLTVRMAARLQGFPDSWQFSGRKTASYRQVGNAFPPPVACAVASAIAAALLGHQAARLEAAE